jgi:enterochelin esterase-like enzyme
VASKCNFAPINSKAAKNKTESQTVPEILPASPLTYTYTEEKITGVFSKLLGRNVDVNLLLPTNYLQSKKKYPLLLLNDGQDMQGLQLKSTLEKLMEESAIEEMIVAGVVAGDRMQEYGVAAKKDYLKRGSKAKEYTRYLVTELLPYLIYKYPIDPDASNHSIAGCSMGGLSALDIGWNHPKVFQKVGVFSGSLWWRKRDNKSAFFSEKRDRIMHQQVRDGKKKNGLQFWFQTGTLDEKSDRNKNGVIDSIDDTMDMITELTKKGYRPFHDIAYYEVKDGKHNLETWAAAMPEFLKWAFKKI